MHKIRVERRVFYPKISQRSCYVQHCTCTGKVAMHSMFNINEFHCGFSTLYYTFTKCILHGNSACSMRFHSRECTRDWKHGGERRRALLLGLGGEQFLLKLGGELRLGGEQFLVRIGKCWESKAPPGRFLPLSALLFSSLSLLSSSPLLLFLFLLLLVSALLLLIC